MTLHNNGHHWVFDCGLVGNPGGPCRDRLLIEWWPSSAKLVIRKNWNGGIHVHDWKQAQEQIEKAIARFGRKPTDDGPKIPHPHAEVPSPQAIDNVPWEPYEP